MKRYAKNFLNKTSSIVENKENKLEISEGLNLPAYITVRYMPNINNNALDTSITTSSLNNVTTNHIDLMYVASDKSIHEVGNSEIIFDAFFDYIIRGNTQESNLVLDNNGVKSVNGIKINRDTRGEEE